MPTSDESTSSAESSSDSNESHDETSATAKKNTNGKTKSEDSEPKSSAPQSKTEALTAIQSILSTANKTARKDFLQKFLTKSNSTAMQLLAKHKKSQEMKKKKLEKITFDNDYSSKSDSDSDTSHKATKRPASTSSSSTENDNNLATKTKAEQQKMAEKIGPSQAKMRFEKNKASEQLHASKKRRSSNSGSSSSDDTVTTSSKTKSKQKLTPKYASSDDSKSSRSSSDSESENEEILKPPVAQSTVINMKSMSESDDSYDDDKIKGTLTQRGGSPAKKSAIYKRKVNASESSDDSPRAKRRTAQVNPLDAQFCKDFPELEKVSLTKNEMTIPDISANDDVFILKIPKILDVNNLLKTSIKVGGQSTIQFGNDKFQIHPRRFKKPQGMDILATQNKELLLRKISVIGSLNISKKAPSIIKPSGTLKPTDDKSVVSFPTDLKVRHPLFGADYKTKIVLEDSVKSKLDLMVSSFIKRARKKSKKQEDSELTDDILQMFSFLQESKVEIPKRNENTSTPETSKSKTKKKDKSKSTKNKFVAPQKVVKEIMTEKDFHSTLMSPSMGGEFNPDQSVISKRMSKSTEHNSPVEVVKTKKKKKKDKVAEARNNTERSTQNETQIDSSEEFAIVKKKKKKSKH